MAFASAADAVGWLEAIDVAAGEYVAFALDGLVIDAPARRTGGPAPAVAAVLGTGVRGEAFLRRRPVTAAGEPAELVSAWVPLAVAEGTGLDSADPLVLPADRHELEGAYSVWS